MRVGTALVVAVAVLATATGTAVAMDNTAPFAEAGLDQTVPPETTVYLDANGSSDPDGDITSVEWTLRTPDGDTRRPDCVDCRRTHFTASTVGRYTVSLTVTDDDGASSADRLYVTVATDTGPEVSVSGPSTATRDRETTLTADVSRTESALQSVAWVVNGSVVDRQTIDGNSATVDLTHSFAKTGPKSVSAVVYDTMGDRGSDAHTVVVTPETDGASTAAGGDSSDSLCYEPSGLCGDGDIVYSYGQGEEKYIVDTNGEPGIQRLGPDGKKLVDYGDLSNIEGVTRLNGGSDKPEALQSNDASVKITADLTMQEVLDKAIEVNDVDLEKDGSEGNENTQFDDDGNDRNNDDGPSRDNDDTERDPSDDDDEGSEDSSPSLSDGGDDGGSDDSDGSSGANSIAGDPFGGGSGGSDGSGGSSGADSIAGDPFGGGSGGSDGSGSSSGAGSIAGDPFGGGSDDSGSSDDGNDDSDGSDDSGGGGLFGGLF